MTIRESLSGERVQRERVCVDCRNTGWVPYIAELLDGTFEDALALCHCPKSEGEVPQPITINSFTKPGVSYSVDLEEQSCSCPRYEWTGSCEKHLVLAQAIRRLRDRRTGSTEHDEEMLYDFTRRIFSKITTKDSPEEAYKLFYAIQGYRYKTKALVEAARRRHVRVLEMTGSRAA